MSRAVDVWNTATAAPHRVMFLAGVLQGVLALVWWSIDLMGRYAGLYPPFTWTLPSIWVHAFLMIYGFFPFLFFGFLFTTYPNWMNGQKIDRSIYVPSFLLTSGGLALVYLGLFTVKAVLQVGVGLMLAGWAVGLFGLTRVLVRTPHPDKRHPRVTTVAFVLGWLGMASFLLWTAGGPSWSIEVMRAGIWFFLLPIFFTVCHRMIPFFSSRVLPDYTMVRPYPVLYVALACMVGHATFQIAGLRAYLWLFDLPLFGIALFFSYTWELRRSLRVRLLSVLHISFLWLVIAMALYSLQSLVQFVTSDAILLLGNAPLHALTIGFLSSMVLAMVSRVTLGHSGRALVADGVTWAVFLCFQTTALVRIVAEIPVLAGQALPWLYLLATLLWLAFFGFWVVRYAPIYLQPRADGKAG